MGFESIRTDLVYHHFRYVGNRTSVKRNVSDSNANLRRTHVVDAVSCRHDVIARNDASAAEVVTTNQKATTPVTSRENLMTSL